MSVPEEEQTILSLPAPPDTQKVEISTDQITQLKFDQLGPMVVNSDGVSIENYKPLFFLSSSSSSSLTLFFPSRIHLPNTTTFGTNFETFIVHI